MDIRKARVSGRYKRARRAFLAANPLCAECQRRGVVTAANEIDHIKPLRFDPTPEHFWNAEGWQALCSPCHAAKSAREARRETAGQSAWRERVERLAGDRPREAV